MMGAYEMEGPDGAMFDVTVPAFSLDSPHEAARMN
jgi:ApaG protein